MRLKLDQSWLASVLAASCQECDRQHFVGGLFCGLHPAEKLIHFCNLGTKNLPKWKLLLKIDFPTFVIQVTFVEFITSFHSYTYFLKGMTLCFVNFIKLENGLLVPKFHGKTIWKFTKKQLAKKTKMENASFLKN